MSFKGLNVSRWEWGHTQVQVQVVAADLFRWSEISLSAVQREVYQKMSLTQRLCAWVES